MNKENICIGVVVFLLFVGGIIGVFVTKKTEKKLQTYADRILAGCKSNPYKLDCYNSEIPKLMDKPFSLSMEDAFQVTRFIQIKAPTYSYCYELGRTLSAKETKKDPEKWKNVVARCPATMCNNGCLHGALQERYKGETLTRDQIAKMIPDLKTACEPHDLWNPVKVEVAMCYYGMGNLLMNATGTNPKSSSDLCRVLGKVHNDPYYTYSCIRGVFMSMYQNKENEVGRTVSVADFCDTYQREERSACLDASWQLNPKQAENPEGAIKFCEQSRTSQEMKQCYSSLLQVATISLGINRGDLNALKDYCLGLPSEYKGFCFGTVASRLLLVDPNKYTEKAVQMCSMAQKSGFAKDCFTMLIDYAAMNFHKGSPSAVTFCDRLPSVWKTNCRNKLL